MGAQCDGRLNATGGCPKCGHMAPPLAHPDTGNRPPGDACYRGYGVRNTHAEHLRAVRQHLLRQWNAREHWGLPVVGTPLHHRLRLWNVAYYHATHPTKRPHSGR